MRDLFTLTRPRRLLLVQLLGVLLGPSDGLSQDSITIDSAPAVIRRDGTYQIQVTYSSSVNRDISLALESATGRFLLTSSVIEPNVPAGSNQQRTLTIELEDRGTPRGVLRWAVRLLPVGSSKQFEFTDRDERRVVVLEDQDVLLVNAPEKVSFQHPHPIFAPPGFEQPGIVNVSTIEVAYSIFKPISDIEVSLLSTDFVSGFGGQSRIEDIEAGLGIREIVVTSQIPTNTSYMWQAFVTKPGADHTKLTPPVFTTPIELAFDTVSISSAPSSIPASGTHNVELTYTANPDVSTGARDLDVVLLLPPEDLSSTNAFLFFGGTTITNVMPGSGVLTAQVTVVNNPSPGSRYTWSCNMFPENTSFSNAYAYAENLPVTVTESIPGSVVEDTLAFTLAPSSIPPQGSQTLELMYETDLEVSEGSRDIVVNLLSDGDFSFFGGTRVSGIPPGANGVVSVEVMLQSSPPAGTSYIWSSFIGPPGGEFSDRFGFAENVSVSVVEPEELSASLVLHQPLQGEPTLRITPTRSGGDSQVLEHPFDQDSGLRLQTTTDLINGAWIDSAEHLDATEPEVLLDPVDGPSSQFFRFVVEP